MSRGPSIFLDKSGSSSIDFKTQISLRRKAPPKISHSKVAFEKYKPRGFFSEFYSKLQKTVVGSPWAGAAGNGVGRRDLSNQAKIMSKNQSRRTAVEKRAKKMSSLPGNSDVNLLPPPIFTSFYLILRSKKLSPKLFPPK